MSLRLKDNFNLEHFFKLNKLNILCSYKERENLNFPLGKWGKKVVILTKKMNSSKK